MEFNVAAPHPAIHFTCKKKRWQDERLRRAVWPTAI